MGSDNLFHKVREERKKRETNIINQRAGNWLIVTEGTKTEPIYFKKIIDIVNNNLPKDSRLKCEICGMGKNTISLVDSVLNLQYFIDKKIGSKIILYEKIFVVFDRDSFSKQNFNRAINLCKKNDYIPLWSNEAFEYWLLLHFNYYNSNLSRLDYREKIENELKKKNINIKYQKNSEKVIDYIIQKGSLINAINNAKRIHKEMIRSNIKPDEANCMTTMYRFFEEIDRRNEELSVKKCKEIFK